MKKLKYNKYKSARKVTKEEMEFIKEVFFYEDGFVYRKYKNGKTAKVGSEDKEGYLRCKIKGKEYRIHRLVWLLVNGNFPNKPLDHINRIKDDNRIENLRLATDSQNSMNTPLFKSNTSGYRGVYWCKDHDKWRAEIHYKKKKIHIGYFDNPQEGYEAYCKKAEELYGEFFDRDINCIDE